MTIDRNKFLLELKLRENIREHYERVFPKIDYHAKRDESIVENYIRNVLKEARKSPIPFDSTGINILQDTLKKIIPILHDDFFSLTSDINQRKSFRAHIINAFKNSLAPIDTYNNGLMPDIETQPAPVGELEPNDTIGSGPEQDGGGVNIDVGEPQQGIEPTTEPEAELEPDQELQEVAPEDERFIDIEDPAMTKEKPVEEPSEEEKFAVPGEDPTGRNVALQSYKKIEKNITDGYQLLGMPEDRKKFYEFGLANLKVYFDRWEAEVTPGAEAEPDVDIPDAETIG